MNHNCIPLTSEGTTEKRCGVVTCSKDLVGWQNRPSLCPLSWLFSGPLFASQNYVPNLPFSFYLVTSPAATGAIYCLRKSGDLGSAPALCLGHLPGSNLLCPLVSAVVKENACIVWTSWRMYGDQN